MMRFTQWMLIAAGVMLVSGCNDDQALREIRDGQRELRVKLEAMEKKIDAIASRPAAPAQAAAADPNKIFDLPAGNSPTRGPADAPVVITEFADFQCPFCATADTLVKQVMQAYPKEVKFVYKEFPLTSIHSNAMNASKAAQAAKLQGKYWEMHEKLFANAKALDAASLKKYAGEIGLDVAKWEADMASPEVQAAIQDDMALAQKSQVRGTPTMFINGKRVTTRTLDDIKAMVDTALKEKKG